MSNGMVRLTGVARPPTCVPRNDDSTGSSAPRSTRFKPALEAVAEEALEGRDVLLHRTRHRTVGTRQTDPVTKPKLGRARPRERDQHGEIFAGWLCAPRGERRSGEAKSPTRPAGCHEDLGEDINLNLVGWLLERVHDREALAETGLELLHSLRRGQHVR